MAADSRYDEYADAAAGLEPRRSGWSTCLTGCLVTIVVVLALGVMVGFWVWHHWRDWVAAGAAEAIQQGLDASDLPAQEKQQVRAQVDRLSTAFRDGRLSAPQLASIMTQLLHSPLMTTVAVTAAERMYFAASGLSDDEKAQGRRALRRFVRGMVDGKIDQQSTGAVMRHIADRESDGTWKLRQQLTDDELRAFLEAAKTEADRADIPAEPQDVDPSDELKRIVDQALGES